MWSITGCIPRNEVTIPILNALPPLDEYPGWLVEEVTTLSQLQKTICTLRYNNVSYSDIQKLTNITSPNTITSVIRLTAGSRVWNKSQPGGTHSLISDVIIKILKNKVQCRRNGLNCMKTFEAKGIILEEIENAYERGKKRLQVWHCDKILPSFEEEFQKFNLTESIFKTTCQRADIFVMSGEQLELLRRRCCNSPAIDSYFNTIDIVVRNVNPKYKYNADETGLASKRTFKVLTDDKNFHVTLQNVEGSHISCMCCFSASGDVLDPFFIFTKRETTLKELDDIPNIFISTSKNGWMTASLWDIWCICFVSHIQDKRERGFLDKQQKVLLFVDGHPSRLSPFGMRLLVKFSVICIIFAAHSSHVLQPFDIDVASPLKIDYIKELADPKVARQATLDGLCQAEMIRRRRVIAFINAWRKRTITSLRNAFTHAGLEPFDKNGLARAELIADPGASGAQDRSVRVSPISGKIATDNLGLLQPFQWRTMNHNTNRFDLKDIQPNDISSEMIRCIWSGGTAETGKIFNQLPPILVDGHDILHQ